MNNRSDTDKNERPVAAEEIKTVLLVEDRADLRKMFRSLLESIGYRVLCACDGNEAVTFLQEGTVIIDLVLSDVDMPGLSGTALVDWMKESFPEMKIVLMSGFSREVLERDWGLKPGMDLINKPIRLNVLEEKLKEVLGKKE